MRLIKITLSILLLGVILVGCSEQSSKEKEAQKRDDNATNLVNKQPARSMDYSPTRATINQWIDTWEDPNKIAYVYYKGSNGQITEYVVLKGLPVSYCASLTPPFDIENRADGDLVVPAQTMDGVYYSGNQCNQYYGVDATTDTMIEWSIGGSQDYFLSERPMPAPDAEPIGFTTIEDIENQEDQGN